METIETGLITKYSDNHSQVFKFVGHTGFIKYYNLELNHKHLDLGFLKDVVYTSMPDIQFIEFVTRDCVYTMVEQFYLEIFKIVLEQITEKYPWTEIVSMDHVNNVQRVTFK